MCNLRWGWHECLQMQTVMCLQQETVKLAVMHVKGQRQQSLALVYNLWSSVLLNAAIVQHTIRGPI